MKHTSSYTDNTVLTISDL